MEKYLARVNGWIKYGDFDPLKHVYSDEIVLYINEMYLEAARRRDEFDLPSRDYKDIGGNADVRFQLLHQHLLQQIQPQMFVLK